MLKMISWYFCKKWIRHYDA